LSSQDIYPSSITNIFPHIIFGMTKLINSLQNPLVKNILLLQEKPRERKQQNLIVIEGFREIRLAISAGYTLQALLFCPDFITDNELSQLTSQSYSSFESVEINPEVFNKLAYRKETGGVLALATPRKIHFRDIPPRPKPLVLVLETVEKPGNLGAMLRTADAANMDAVVICDPQTDIFNPNAIRASIGCIFTMPVVISSNQETLQWLRNNRIKMFATALTAHRFYHETDFRSPSAFIMGSEAYGLSDYWLDEADELIKIPMMGKIDSMNVSACAAVVIYEAMRQRNFR